MTMAFRRYRGFRGYGDLSSGSTGAAVWALQTKLGIATTGTFDDTTAAAVSAYQTANNLPSTGTVDAATASSLGISMNNADYPDSAAGTTTTNASGQTVYTVVHGDTLSAIATRFGTTYQALAATNGIADPNVIAVGQQIIVPGTDTGNKGYTPGSDDSGTPSAPTAKKSKAAAWGLAGVATLALGWWANDKYKIF
jgi:lysozyme